MDDRRSGNGEVMEQRRDEAGKPLPVEVRWTLGCLVAAAAMVGVVIFVSLVAIALTPPTWVNVVLGVVLALGGASLAWLVATALGQRGADTTERPTRLPVREDGGPTRGSTEG